jgi:hypothetical protein
MQTLVFSNRMVRRTKIVLSLLAVVLLVRPFDCFASARTPQAMECCLKGKCAPTAKADDCCKNTVPGATHFVGSKGGGQSAPVLDVAPSFIPGAPPVSSAEVCVNLFRHPPPSGSLNARSLPLLI